MSKFLRFGDILVPANEIRLIEMKRENDKYAIRLVTHYYTSDGSSVYIEYFANEMEARSALKSLEFSLSSDG